MNEPPGDMYESQHEKEHRDAEFTRYKQYRDKAIRKKDLDEDRVLKEYKAKGYNYPEPEKPKIVRPPNREIEKEWDAQARRRRASIRHWEQKLIDGIRDFEEGLDSA